MAVSLTLKIVKNLSVRDGRKEPNYRDASLLKCMMTYNV